MPLGTGTFSYGYGLNTSGTYSYGGTTYTKVLSSGSESWNPLATGLRGRPDYRWVPSGTVTTTTSGGAAPALNLNQPHAEYGAVIPISMGTRRMPSQLIAARQIYGVSPDFRADFAVSFGWNGDDDPAATQYTKLWANGALIWDGGTQTLPGGWTVTLYTGTDTQTVDPWIAANDFAQTAYRLLMYAVFQNFPLTNFNNSLPGISAEIAGTLVTDPNEWVQNEDVDSTISIDGLTVNRVSAIGDSHSTIWGSVVAGTGAELVYYEAECLTTGSYSVGIGVSGSPEVEPLVALGGVGGGTLGYRGTDGKIRMTTLLLGTQSTFGTAGDIIGVALNRTTQKIWFAKNGVWVGDPALGTGGYSLTTASGPVSTPGAQLRTAVSLLSTGASLRGAFDSGDWTYPAPSGFTTWSGFTVVGEPDEITLVAFISRIAEYAGLDPGTDLDFDPAIIDTIKGGVIAAPTDFRDFAANLCRAYGIDFFEGDTIRFVKKVVGDTYAEDYAIPAADLLNQGDRAITTTRGADESPQELNLGYIDQTQQFRYNHQRARRILYPVRTTQSQNKAEFSIPVVIPANTAITLAGQTLYREAGQNVKHSADAFPKYIKAEPSDIVGLTAGDTAYTVKLTRVEIGPDLAVTLGGVNLYTHEDIVLEGDSGQPLPDWEGIGESVAGDLSATEGADTFQATDGSMATRVTTAADTRVTTTGDTRITQ